MTPVGLLVRFRIVVQRSFIRYYKVSQQYKAYDVILTQNELVYSLYGTGSM